VVGEAIKQVYQLIGKPIESVTGMEKDGRDWTVTLEVLELSRIPSTTDVLGSYEVSLDKDGELTGIQRTRRYPRAELAQLLGRRPETVSRMEHRDDGWHLGLEVVELERIPHSTDVLASYDVLVDDDGSLLQYARTRRYYRNRAEDE